MAGGVLAEIRENSIAPFCNLSDRGLQAVFSGFFDVVHLSAGQVYDVADHDICYSTIIRGSLVIEGGAAEHAGKVIDVAATADGPLRLKGDLGKVRFKAIENTLFLSGNGDVIDDIVSIDELVRDEDRPADIIQLIMMRHARCFANLPTSALIEVYWKMDRVKVEADQDVVRQDMKGDNFYFIREGAAEVWREELEDDEPQHVATLATGDSFGEEALILGGARNATVRMITPGELLALDEASYKELIARRAVHRIPITEARDRLSEGAQLVDVRYDDEWEEGHIPGAVHIPLSKIRERGHELDHDHQVVVYCRSGRRSQVGAMLLAQAGFTAFSMDGGILEWPGEKVVPE